MPTDDRIEVSATLNGEPIVLGKIECIRVKARPCPRCGAAITERGPRLCSRCECLASAEAAYEVAKEEAAEYLTSEATRERWWWES